MSKYFQGLNYSLANEDSWIEYHLAPKTAESIFTVCGSGSRVTPLMALHPKELHVVDLSDIQLMLCRLRVAAAKKLSYADYLYFLGYKRTSPGHSTRRELISRLDLTAEDLHYWKEQEIFWKGQGFIYLGKWERHFMTLGQAYKYLTMTDLSPLFEAQNMDEQHELLEKFWKPKFFKRYTQVVMNEFVANKLLYKGHFAGAKDKKTKEVSASEFIYNEFNDLFNNTWVRGNYFLQMIFLGKVAYQEGLPCEANEEIFEKIKSSESKLYYHQDNLLKLLNDEPHSFYSLSDTFSYMKDEELEGFLENLPGNISSNTQMVVRTFMRKPSFTVSSPWSTNSGLNAELARKDCTRMYEFTVLKKE